MTARRTVAAIATLFPVASPRRPAPPAPPAMMDLRPAPSWIVATIRFVQGRDGLLGAMLVGTTAGLVLMMAIGTLVAWQAGRL